MALPTAAPVRKNASWWEWLLQRPGTYVALAAAVLWLDVVTGPGVSFPICFVIPVALAAWYCNPRLAVALAILQPAIRFGYSMLWRGAPNYHWDPTNQISNAAIRAVVLVLLAYFIGRTAMQNRELSRRLRLLGGNLPICIHCKRVQDEQKNWQEIEFYIARNSDMTFTHGLCPQCTGKNYGDIVGVGKETDAG